jgi:DNA-directed RNA polymerase specialized sigma24 family protein
MNRLYTLSLLLTADHSLAEKCFVQGLEDAQKGNPVFREWARSWARRTIIANAIRLINPRVERTPAHSTPSCDVADPANTKEEITAILALPTFERFAFVMSVFEGYSDRECALLLECSIADLVAARTRALQQIGASAEHHRKLVGLDQDRPSHPVSRTVEFQQDAAHLASSI